MQQRKKQTSHKVLLHGWIACKKEQQKKIPRGAVWTAFLLCCLAFAGCASSQTEFVEEALSSVVPAITESSGVQGEELYVYVCGEVRKPGVYRFSVGARVYEALDKAGGLTKEAEETALNQARVMEDGEEIRVPARGEAGQGYSGVAGQEMSGDSGKVNINTADAAQLATLTGIGQTRAEAIIAWREANGGFQKPEDLKNVDGIGDKTFDKLKDDIVVR